LVTTLLGAALNSMWALGASYPVLPPDPVGGKVFRERVYHEALFPVAIIAGALLAAYIAHLIALKAHKSHAPS
jgi:hypothetical protein